MATHDDLLIAAKLRARIALLDGKDEWIGYLGDNEPVCDAAGWPNRTDRGCWKVQQPPRDDRRSSREPVRVGVADRRPLHQTGEVLRDGRSRLSYR